MSFSRFKKPFYFIVAIIAITSSVVFFVSTNPDNMRSNNTSLINHDMQKSELVIDTSGHDNVIVLADEWIAGTKPITVYSNDSVKDYRFYRNGTEIRSDTNPVNYTSGTWNPSYVRTTYGTRISGTLASLYLADGNQWIQNRAGAGINRRADVIADFDQKLIGVWAHASLTDIWINATVSGSGVGSPTEFYLQRWNAPTTAWINLLSFTTWGPHVVRVHFTGGNLTQFTNSLNAITLSNDFRVYARDNNNFQLNVDQIAMNYNTSNVVDTTDHYTAIDSFDLDSTILVDGWYNLTAKIQNMTDDYHQDTKWVRVDNTAPVFSTATHDPSPPVYDNESISISATITELNIESVTGKYVNQFGTEIIHQETDLVFDHEDIFTVGDYDYLIRAIDKAGNFVDTLISFTVLAHYVPPTYLLFIDVVNDNQDLEIDFWASKTNETLIYIDGDLEYTVADETALYEIIEDLSVGIHYIDVDIYDVDHVLFKSLSSTIHVYAPENGGGGGYYDPPLDYPDPPFPPPTNEISTIDFGPFASLTGQQSLWIVVIAGVLVITGYLIYRLWQNRPKKKPTRRKK